MTENKPSRPEPPTVNGFGVITSLGEAKIGQAICDLSLACHNNSFAHGWYDGDTRTFGDIIALCHSELSEALEHFRNGQDPQEIIYTDNGKPDGVAVEMADTIIRILDWAGANNIPIAQAIIEKHRYNQSRPYRHGGKAL